MFMLDASNNLSQPTEKLSRTKFSSSDLGQSLSYFLGLEEKLKKM